MNNDQTIALDRISEPSLQIPADSISAPKKLILVDGSSYFYRAFHALPPLTNSKGQSTGAIYGVANMLRRLLKDVPSKHIAVVFDAKGKTFRDALYPEYKANRLATPPELSSQFEPLIRLLRAMGFPILIIDNVEADDVIGTLVRQALTEKYHVLISTSDKDIAQLVTPEVTLINTMTGQQLNPQGVVEKFGVRPDQIIDYLTLVGDSSDNVPGVPKCGPKTAAKWLQEYQTLDNLIASADEITGKVGESFRNSLSFLPLSKQLVTILQDVELPITIHELSMGAPELSTLKNYLEEFEFKNWLKELEASTESATVSPSASIAYEIILKEAQLTQWMEKLAHTAVLCFDLHTTSLNPLDADIVGISFAIPEETTAAYLPLKHLDNTVAQLDFDRVMTFLKPILENSNILKLSQNIKFEMNVLRSHNITLHGASFDTLLESYVLNSVSSRHQIENLALKYLDHKMQTLEDICGKGKTAIRFAELSVAKAAPFAVEEAYLTLQLHQLLYPKLEQALHTVFHQIEMMLVNSLADLEWHGVLIDKDKLAKLSEQLKIRISALEQEAYVLAACEFNLNSTQQLQHILFDKLQLPILEKTPKGQPSTGESVLQELAENYRFPAIILEYRGLTKLVTTYLESLPQKIHARTGRVHTSYNQAVTATGRLSSTDPNLQNIPIRKEEGHLIRQAFIAPEGHRLIAADYSQIELRIMAHLSNDPSLVSAFKQGLDIHRATASEIFGVKLEDVTTEQRRRSKAVNFGLIYGMSSFGLTKQLGIDRKDAQYYIDRYFERYPGVKTYMDKTRAMAHKQGFVETLFGRRLYLPDINARNKMLVRAAERTAINAPMQGTAADLIKKAMVAVTVWQNTSPMPPVRMIMQVHDELVFEVREDFVEEAIRHIRHLMEQVAELAVPLEVSIGVGENWDEAHG